LPDEYSDAVERELSIIEPPRKSYLRNSLFGKPHLADHRGKRTWPNFIAESAMRSNVHEPDFSTMHSAIPTMTSSIVPVEHEVMFFDNRDECAKRAF